MILVKVLLQFNRYLADPVSWNFEDGCYIKFIEMVNEYKRNMLCLSLF